jgi:inosine-uridine nucleoside N-ribohydrolase
MYHQRSFTIGKMKSIIYFITFIFCLYGSSVYAQLNAVKPRMRVIIDNDFGGDPDGLFQLVHHLLSPSVEIRGIIGSHLRAGDGWDTSKNTADHAKQKAEEVLKIMHLTGTVPVYPGSNFALKNIDTPQTSEASDAIIKEAMRDDTKLPLYVVCGAGLTDIASAFLSEPRVAKRLTLIWIGGPEYEDLAFPPPGASEMEYNLAIDPIAVQVVFNKSEIPIWQVPRNAYRQVMISFSTLILKIKHEGEIGNYLFDQLDNLTKMFAKFHLNIGEIYILGDSPLVLLTALQSSFEPDPSSSHYALKHCPIVNNKGLYEMNDSGRFIRVYTQLDVRLLFEDFYSKLTLFNEGNVKR